MHNMFVAISLVVLWIVLLTLGLSAQADLPGLPDFPELPDGPRQMQSTIPPFDPPTGAVITVTITMDDLKDNGNCTLREAIQAANTDTAVDDCPAGDGEDLIVLAAGVYVLNIEGRSEDNNATGDLDIRSSLVISGAGAEETALDANQIDRVLHVHADGNVEMLNLSIRNGLPATGADTGCGDTGESACPGEDGGGIFNAGTLIVRNAVIAESSAGTSGDEYQFWNQRSARGGRGGGIFNDGMLILEKSTVRNNRAGAGGNTIDLGSWTDGGDGGGLANMGHVVLSSVKVVHNRTGRGDVNAPYIAVMPTGDGAGIWNTGFLTITSSYIDKNRSDGEYEFWVGMRGSGAAGGIWNGGSAVITGTQMAHNRSGTGDGGGLLNIGHMEVLSTIVMSNTTSYSCGGRYCALSGDGGGIVNSGTLIVRHSNINENQTADIDGFGGGSGGGIANLETGALRLINSTIMSNATGSAVVGGFEPCNRPSGDGAGIFNAGHIEVVGSTVTSNKTAPGNVWHQYCVTTGGSGGGVYNTGVFSLRNSTISQNLTGSGVCIKEECSQGGSGGGIYNTATAIIEQSTFVGNSVSELIACNEDETDCVVPGEGNQWYNSNRIYLSNSLFTSIAPCSSSDFAGPIVSLGHNLFECDRSNAPSNNDRDVFSPYAWLAPLADNGGPTLTHALLPQSPALNAGNCTAFDGTPITEDQRGEPRPQGEGCDIGAYESNLEYVPPEEIFLPVIERNE